MLLRVFTALPFAAFCMTSAFAQNFQNNSVENITLQNLVGAGSVTQNPIGEIPKTKGILTLSGINTYTGGTFLNAGTIAVDNDNNLGALNGTLTFNGGTLLATNGITSNRTIIIGRGGAAINANTHNSLFTGMIINNADGNNHPLILNDAITNGGQITLTANNSFNGPTVVDGTVLKLGNDGNTGSVMGSIFLTNDLAKVKFDRRDDNSITNNIYGEGHVYKLNTNKLTLFGDISVLGMTYITAGRLQIGDNNAKGSISGNIDIATNSELIFNRSDNTTYAGVISGDGRVIQSGLGSTTLTNTSTYTGNTTVQAGALYVNGSIATSAMTTINAPGTLGGTGTVGNAINNGIVNPGAIGTGTLGTLTFNGTFVNNGNLTLDVISATNGADRIVTTGATTLGGTLNVVGAGTGYSLGQRILLVDASNTLSATSFTNITTSGTFGGFRPVVTEEGGNIVLRLDAAVQNAVGDRINDRLPVPSGENKKNTAKVIDKIITSGYLPPLFTLLQELNGNGLSTAIDQFSGEIANTGKQAGLELGKQFMRAMLDPFTSRACLSDCGQQKLREMSPNRPSVTTPLPKAQGNWMGWTTVSAAHKSVDGDLALATHTTKISPVSAATGMEFRYDDQATLGFSLSGGQANYAIEGGLGTGTNNAAMLGVYGRFSSGNYGLSAAAFTGFQDADYKRTVALGGLVENLNGKTTGVSFGGRIEAARKFEMGALIIAPYVALQAQTFRANGYSEKAIGAGGATAALTFGSQASNSVRTEIGFGVDYATSLRHRLNFRAAYAREFADGVSTQAAFVGASTAPFTVYGATANRDSMLIKAGTEYALTNAMKISGNLTGEFSGASRSIAADVALKYSF